MGTTIVANLFKPANFDPKRKYAAVAVTHPFGGVKEQTSGLYAQRSPMRSTTHADDRAIAVIGGQK